MTIEQYAIFCILWTFVAGLVQTLHPKYKTQNNWKNVPLGLAMNYVFAPICYTVAMLKWNTDLLLILVQEKIKRQEQWEKSCHWFWDPLNNSWITECYGVAHVPEGDCRIPWKDCIYCKKTIKSNHIKEDAI